MKKSDIRKGGVFYRVNAADSQMVTFEEVTVVQMGRRQVRIRTESGVRNLPAPWEDAEIENLFVTPHQAAEYAIRTLERQIKFTEETLTKLRERLERTKYMARYEAVINWPGLRP